MARRKTGDKKVESKKSRPADGEVNVQADNYSIALKELHVGGDVGGDIRIGHTIGYTAEQVSVLLKQITTTLQPKKFDGRCPYKGLEVFEEEDAELFFGRERLVEDLIGRVKESRTVFITGPSGSGKSSLVRAGLIHTLKKGAIKSSDRWLYETMKPGREPLKDLALAFSRLKSPELEDYFLAHSTETDVLNKCAESVLSGRKDQRFVLFVDQFEEVFTQINSEEERVAFINMLAHAGTVENGRVIVLFAMRSDFVSNCATYPALNELLSQEFRQIGAMQPEELVSAIALPAGHVGLPIEDELIAQIINDMKGEPGALPLMQFALKDLFDSQQEKGGIIALRLDDYLKHGGIHKSLERHADATFAKLSEGEQKLTRSIFSGLIEIGRGTQDTKRTALFDELVPSNTTAEDILAIVQKLADARLIITDEQAGKDTVTISHEKLIEAWPWLKKLVNENRDSIALQNEIANDAKEWEEHHRDPSYLYFGARLANAQEQLAASKLLLSGTSNEFVQAGIFRKRREQLTRILSMAGVITLVVAGILLFSYISITNSNNLAEQSKKSEKTQAALASTSDAIAVTAQANADEAERQAEEAKKQARIAFARQLAARAQALDATSTPKGIVVLLALEAMHIFPSSEAAQVLINSGFGSYTNIVVTYNSDVESAAISPDEQYVVTVSGDGTVCVQLIYFLGGKGTCMIHDATVTSAAFSPDGKYVVSGSVDNTARVWEASTGVEIARMTHDAQVSSVIFSPDGKFVASNSIWEQTVRIWETFTGKEVALIAPDGYINSFAFSPDGEYVVSGEWDSNSSPGSVHVWKTLTGQEVAHMTHDALVSSVAFSPDGKHVVSGSWDKTARVWEASTGMEVARMIHNGRITSVAFSPDGKYVVSGSVDIGDSRGFDNTARVWEASTGTEVARMTHGFRVNFVAFSPHGKYVVSAGCDKNDYDNNTGCIEGTARVWLWQPDDLTASVCGDQYWFGPRNLTRAQWKEYIGDALPYQAICPDWPLEVEATPTAAP